MRIRSIRPEFWSSEDIAAMDWHTRLVYIGLWSYVDDNGVGRDLERLIVSALFPLDEDLSESSLRVHGALKHLEAAGNITRYTVRGKPYLHITAWDKHQKINRPTGSRFPLPTCEDAEFAPVLNEPSVSPHANAPLGEGEERRRGEEDKDTCASADAERDGAEDDLARWKRQERERQARRDRERYAEFAEWYAEYPRKRSKGQAMKAYKAARKKADAETLLAGLRAQLPDLTKRPADKIPYPATWLNGECWADQPDAQADQSSGPVYITEQPPDGLSTQEYLAWHAAQREKARRA